MSKWVGHWSGCMGPALLLLDLKSAFPLWVIQGCNKPYTAGQELGLSFVPPFNLVHTWLFYGTSVHFTIIQGKQCKAWVYFCYRAQGGNQLLRLVFVLLRLLTFPSVLNFLVSSFQWRKKECLCLTTDDLHGNYHLISISNCRFLQALQRCVQVSVQM